jgi:hypothetical protein
MRDKNPPSFITYVLFNVVAQAVYEEDSSTGFNTKFDLRGAKELLDDLRGDWCIVEYNDAPTGRRIHYT